MDLDAIRERAKTLEAETWGFVRGDGPLWTFSGSSDLVMALSEMPDDVADLLTALSLATARAAGLEQALRAIEWDPNTTPNQCAWCMYGRAVGHADDCAFARVLALAALAPAAGATQTHTAVPMGEKG